MARRFSGSVDALRPGFAVLMVVALASPVGCGADTPTSVTDSGVDASTNDAATTDSGGDAASDGGGVASNCAPGGAGLNTCGSGSESCCTSLLVTGGTYDRTYTNNGSGATGQADPATVADFRLDKYEVTVGRFRQFVSAWNHGAGWTPPAGSGKHTHLNGGLGLANSASPGTYETGWVTSENIRIAPTSTNLACAANYDTWTTTAASRETLPINCVSFWESAAFCVWDGGFLPTEAEWEYAAAGGSEERQYAWGTAAPGTENQYAIYDCGYPSAGGCTGVVNIAPVGTPTSGAGRWGQLDLAGNVYEWNLDWNAPYVTPCTDCAALSVASFRVFRGGYFSGDTSILLPPIRSYGAPTYRASGLGFRCARTP